MLATGSSGYCFRTHAATSFDPANGCVMLIVVRRSSARSALLKLHGLQACAAQRRA
jgi:hypothetical protein